MADKKTPKPQKDTALKRIGQAAETNAEVLKLWELTNLKSLSLYSNQLRSLPPKISQLVSLIELDLGGNQLTSLPSEIWKLSALKRLSISDSSLPEFPVELWQRNDWEILGLKGVNLETLPHELFQCNRLAILDLSYNKLTSLPPEIGQLTNLMELYLQVNQLTSLPLEIGKLANLIQLNLSVNQLTSLPKEIGQLTSLTHLHLWNNQLTRLPSEIGQLANLTTLNLQSNQLTSPPKEIENLKKLENLNLRGNPLQIAIPAKWSNVIFGDNPYAREIIGFYKKLWEEGGHELGEARVLVIGEGGVGKTSIVKRLIDNTFDDKEDTTLIVEKRPLPLGDVRAQVWDFGGQEHMHATHQFFFSGRSLYLLVFDTHGSLEQNKVEYWLTLINAYSQNASVILVGNKSDQHEMDVEKRRLREKYPNIRGFVSTSASAGEHIAELRQKIQEEVRAMPQVRVLFSADYLAVKDEMETLNAAHISHEEFVKICERHGVTDAKDQDTLLDLLHDLGTVLYFRDADGNPLLPALGVLNPNWVTGGVYRIVTNAALKDKFKGKLSMTLLREILHEPAYARHIEDIVKLLERFELCYRTDDSCYWLPSLMERDEPAELGDWTSAMKFEYWYPELPKSVIVRFIVKVHKTIFENKVWRYGAVLKLDDNTALVRADERDKRVSIYIAGEESTRRDALAILRAHFDEIHAMFELPPKAYIYPPQYPDLQIPFADMKTLAKSEREHKAAYQGKTVTINLRELLDGFITPEERRMDEEREREEFKRKSGGTYNITNFNVGGNMEGSNVAIGERHQITQTVQDSFNTFPVELQTALAELIKATETLLQKAEESERKEEVKEELESLQSEAKKSKPKAERIKVTVEGLKKAAQNLKDVGEPVIKLAIQVIALLNTLPS
jgi:internalin A